MGLLALPLPFLFPRRKRGTGGKKSGFWQNRCGGRRRRSRRIAPQLENADAPLHFRKCLHQDGGGNRLQYFARTVLRVKKEKRQSTRLLSGRQRKWIDPPTQQRRTAFLLHLTTTYPSSSFSLSRWLREIYYSTVPIPRTTVV